MSTRKTTSRRIHPARPRLGLAVGMVLASRLDLTPQSSAQTVAAPPMNSAPITRSARRADIPQYRQGAVADGREHPDRVTSAPAGSHRTSLAAAHLTICSAGFSTIRMRSRTIDSAPGQGRGQNPRAPSAARADHDCLRQRIHHQQGRDDPHEQPRRGRRDEDRGGSLRRGSRPGVSSQDHRPRRADRQRADSAHREAESSAP